ncbi:hypothetical protein [Paenibacillus dendritiformis]|uniref:hypothetical protein n=1 Tax=Paenibacillus dendritiformis TaxID=130049 RepID=UPI0020C2FE97|nr:hypothetical protein [Paenibacillus dendritiformis]CAH8773254.1 hypothetical protein H7S4_006028 [Paenibacillus dendritiformis]
MILHDICEDSVDIVYENVDDEDNIQDFAGQKDIHRWITLFICDWAYETTFVSLSGLTCGQIELSCSQRRKFTSSRKVSKSEANPASLVAHRRL